MSVLIKGMKMPKNCRECKIKAWEERYNVYVCPFGGILELSCLANGRRNECPLVELPEKHGRLVDIDELARKMYHDAFETDTDLQKWDSGCWIRYKLFENNRDAAPTIIEAEDGQNDNRRN